MKLLVYFKVIVIFIITFQLAYCQAPLNTDLVYVNYAFIEHAKNKIINEKGLQNVIQKALKIKAGSTEKLNVLHIGDSHLQQGSFGETFRMALQKELGNAGRGFISPQKLSGSNEPSDYWLSCNQPVIRARLLNSNPVMPMGLGALSIGFQSDSVQLFVRVKDSLQLNYSFSTLLFFHHQNLNAQIQLFDTLQTEIRCTQRRLSNNCTEIKLNESIFMCNILLTKMDVNHTIGDFYGVSLEKTNNSGLLYHMVGINGAKYSDYVRHAYLFDMWQPVKPDLIVVSLGTNESHKKNLSDSIFKIHFDSFIQILQNRFPESSILVTSPADGFKYGRQNFQLIDVVNNLMEKCMESSLAFWNLYDITGGFGSARRWRAEGLMAADGVHYSKEGYKVQGQLLANSIIQELNRITRK